jgi:hypothetical protein
MGLLFLRLFFSIPAAPAVGEMCCLSFNQLTVEACWCSGEVPCLWRVLLQVAAPTPHAMGRLFAVCPDMPKLLTVGTLYKYILGFVWLNFDRNVAKVWKSEDFL